MTASYFWNKIIIFIVVKIYLSHLPVSMSDSKPSLLVAKGNINQMGGAERDLISVYPIYNNGMMWVLQHSTHRKHCQIFVRKTTSQFSHPLRPGTHLPLHFHKFLTASTHLPNTIGESVRGFLKRLIILIFSTLWVVMDTLRWWSWYRAIKPPTCISMNHTEDTTRIRCTES